MFKIPLTPDFLIYLMAALMALLFDFSPGLKDVYGRLKAPQKRAVMLVSLLALSVLIYGGVCVNVFATSYACDADGLQGVVYVFLLSIGINQGVHALAKPATSTTPTAPEIL